MGRIIFLTALSLLISCDRADKGASQSSSVQKNTRGTPALGKKADARVMPSTKPALPVGRWRSDKVCLEIFANSDFEISLPAAKAGKELIMGHASVSDKIEKTDKGVSLILKTERIWRARWMGRCRKVNKLGHWIEESRAFGATLSKGKPLALQLRPLEEGGIEICPEDESGQITPCTPLESDKPLLGSNWKRGGAPQTIKIGAIVTVKLGPQGHIAIQEADDTQNRIYGSLLPTHISEDKFSLVFKPLKDHIKGKASILGAPIDDKLEFMATRLSGQQVSLCKSPDNCVKLDREFNSYDYGIDYHSEE